MVQMDLTGSSSRRSPSAFVRALKLRVIKTAKTTGLLSFNSLHQQAFESQIKEKEAQVCHFVIFMKSLFAERNQEREHLGAHMRES